jgi:hypothetical protein
MSFLPLVVISIPLLCNTLGTTLKISIDNFNLGLDVQSIRKKYKEQDDVTAKVIDLYKPQRTAPSSFNWRTPFTVAKNNQSVVMAYGIAGSALIAACGSLSRINCVYAVIAFILVGIFQWVTFYVGKRSLPDDWVRIVDQGNHDRLNKMTRINASSWHHIGNVENTSVYHGKKVSGSEEGGGITFSASYVENKESFALTPVNVAKAVEGNKVVQGVMYVWGDANRSRVIYVGKDNHR